MKRIIQFLLIFAITVLSCIPISSTATTTQSETVILIYRGESMYGFADNKTFQDIASSAKDVATLKMNKNGELRLSDTKKNVHGIPPIPEFPDEETLQNYWEYSNSPELVFDASDFSVSEVYCLDGLGIDPGIYIGFSTNEGDFVLYRNMDAGNTYLIPYDIFCTHAKISVDKFETTRQTHYLGGGIEIYTDIDTFLWDGTPLTLAKHEEMLKNYVPPVIAEEETGPNGWIIAGIVTGCCLAAGGIGAIVFFTIRKKKRGS